MTESNRTINVVIAGVGGQGILLASEVLARTALLTGYQVKTNEVHGMAQRGGSVIAQIRYGAEVFSPLVAVGTADVLASFEKIEALRYAHYLSPKGTAIVSCDEMVPVTVSSGKAKYPENVETLLKQNFSRVACIDATAEAAKLGTAQVANIIIMGAVSVELTLPVEKWIEAIRSTIKAKHVDINLKAFDTGRRLINKQKA
jgi:indolepyruvate ferredoxin oxidoreductase, beta subunit